eukprot:COSAG02_NODE_3745_length_6295_cov_288.344093_2_plen_235_part_00
MRLLGLFDATFWVAMLLHVFGCSWFADTKYGLRFAHCRWIPPTVHPDVGRIDVADCLFGVMQTDDCCYQSRCFLLTHPHVTEVSSLTGHNLKRCGTGMHAIIKCGLGTSCVLLHNLDGDRHCDESSIPHTSHTRGGHNVVIAFPTLTRSLAICTYGTTPRSTHAAPRYATRLHRESPRWVTPSLLFIDRLLWEPKPGVWVPTLIQVTTRVVATSRSYTLFTGVFLNPIISIIVL